ncbi:hypothetical protein HX137_29280 [Pseudomonas sp. 165]|uniref:Uncharacterized protein n=1 Tax=Pseudomonas juntendi TaxID=2666183 RepID=A0AAJ5S809_9PSED|nr:MULTISPECIES: hypothetical protein [Pseudomonas]MDM1714717.1 hypothetical protein [Pseudomonas sp. 165]WEA23692.1 hypothetical protein PWA60_27210 [Pseudomonas juntendi]
MRFQTELKGSPNGMLSDDAIRNHAAYLSSETVNVTHGGFMSRAPILLEYWSDGDQFSFRFSPPALRFLEEADDPRLELVADLFSGIDPQSAPSAVAVILKARKAVGLAHAMRLLANEARTARLEDRAKLQKMAGEMSVSFEMQRRGVRFLPKQVIRRVTRDAARSFGSLQSSNEPGQQ